MRLPTPRYDLWIVAVPVVFALVLVHLLRLLFVWFSMSLHFGQEAIFVIEAGSLSLRTALLILLGALTGYAGLWAVIHIREVFRLGRRGVPSEPFAKAMAVLLLFLASAYTTLEFQRVPNAREYLRHAETRLLEGESLCYESAVRMGVPGIDELCARLRDGTDAELAFCGAAGAYHRGDRSEKTRGILHDRIESLMVAASAGSKEVGKHEWATRLVKSPAPAGMWNQEIWSGLRRDSSFWVWWEKAEPSFRVP